jgi:protein phosphatase
VATEAIRFRVFGRTDVGQIREHNEDNFLVADLTHSTKSLREEERTQTVGERGTVFGVCDGMGGAAAGEVASQLAVDIIYERLADGEAPKDRDDLAHRLVQAVEEAGARIFGAARADRTRRGMGTTATIAAMIDSRLFVAQVGDSRAYILRQGNLVQVSRDQSLVNQLIEAGQLTEEEAETFEHNNIILQALGTAETVQVDLTYADLRLGDALLVCSDGLSGMIRAEEIREVLLNVEDPLEACAALTERANAAGGHDNITVIVVRFDAGLAEAETADELHYQKYPLPETADSQQHVLQVPLTGEASIPPEQPSEPSSRLKVGHTMVGLEAVSLEAVLPSRAPEITPNDGNPTAQLYGLEDEPVQIPTTGLAPSVVGFMVLGAMVLVAAAGFVLLR